jgi:hypothetical protein
MLDRRYWRAVYNEERDGFVVEQAGWIHDEPVIEYRFTYLGDEDTGEPQGGLMKWWLEDDLPTGEFYAFGHYPDETAFREDVQRILAEARQRAQDDNLDYFLAITDIVKERAVEAELDDESVFEVEGLFEIGTEDAYLQRPFDGDDRLHDHVERSQDECWRIHVARVVDPTHQPLGWAVFAVLYPGLTASATGEEMATATSAEVLDLDHWREQPDAHLAADAMIRFMLEGARVQEPEFAYLDDSFVLECASVQCSIEQIAMPEWEVLEGDELQAFLNGQRPIVREPSRWHPHETDMVTSFAREMGLQSHIADQLHATLLDTLHLADRFDEDSPWRFLDDDSSDE